MGDKHGLPGMVIFEDVLMTDAAASDTWLACSVRTNPVVNLVDQNGSFPKCATYYQNLLLTRECSPELLTWNEASRHPSNNFALIVLNSFSSKSLCNLLFLIPVAV